jgi:uncharacterized membrane protein YvbJ
MCNDIRIMKHVNIISKYLLLLFILTSFGTTAQAQSPDAVFEQIAAAISKGDAAAVSTHFNTTVEVTLPGADQSYSAQQASFVLKDFFTKNAVQGYKVVHKGSSGATWYATGVYTAATGSFDSNIFVKKIGDKFLITQLRFEAE